MRTQDVHFGVNKKPINRAILHCAAIKTGQFDGLTSQQIKDTVTAWHKQRGFNDIGYHYIINHRGHVTPGRSITRPGAHTIGHNHNSIGILLIETQEIKRIGAFADYFTPLQKQALTELLAFHRIKTVHGHNDYAPKLCPGFKVVQSDFLLPANNGWQSIGDILKKR